MLTSVVVRGKSMHPALRDGDVVLVIKGTKKLDVGNVIVYREGQQGFLVIHRIKSITEQGLITQGDGNSCCDPIFVTPEQVVGKVCLTMPCLGWLRKKIKEGVR